MVSKTRVFSSVRLVVTAGETLPAEIQRRFEERFGVPVLDGIGSTEALHIFLSNHQGRSRPGTTGTPVAGYDVKLLDGEDKEVIDADTPGTFMSAGLPSPRGTGVGPRLPRAPSGLIGSAPGTSIPAQRTVTSRFSGATTT